MNINPQIFEEEFFPVYAGHPLLPVSRTSISRMIHRGAKSITGETVKLEVARIGRRLYTSKQAVIRFVKRLNGHQEN